MSVADSLGIIDACLFLLCKPCAERSTPVHTMSLEWPKAVEHLTEVLGDEVARRWIAPLRLASVSDRAVVLEAPNPFFRDWVVSHYHEHLQRFAGDRQLQVVSAPEDRSRHEPLKAAQGPESVERPEGALNPKYTFERFVVGPSNRFAHAASLAVAESPAKAYNPLFIYGGVGLGKTHLMQAIGQAIVSGPSPVRVVYTSSERFTNELISAIQTKTTAKFRDRYRSVDVLLIDDIHFIAGKESTQEAFFHTFNVLYDAHKQIVVSSDRPPKDIAGLEERLVSRFEWGLVTDIQPPDIETRIAILRKKAEEALVEVPEEVVEFIARQITSNIRELEGAMIRVVAYCRFFARPLAVDTAQEVLKDTVREVGSRLTIELIQRRVGEHFQLPLEELRGGGRQRTVLFPRQVAMYLCRTMTESSLPEIGRAFGGRDHSTVLRAIEKVVGEIAQDEHKKRLVEYLARFVTTTRRSVG